MTDQVVIIESILKVLKASGLERGLLWIPLCERVQADTRCTRDEVDDAVMEAMDQCLVEERETGWIRPVADPEAKRKADDAALERYEDGRQERDDRNEREHDAGRQHSAEGQ
jgi:hypothetical protein